MHSLKKKNYIFNKPTKNKNIKKKKKKQKKTKKLKIKNDNHSRKRPKRRIKHRHIKSPYFPSNKQPKNPRKPSFQLLPIPT